MLIDAAAVNPAITGIEMKSNRKPEIHDPRSIRFARLRGEID